MSDEVKRLFDAAKDFIQCNGPAFTKAESILQPHLNPMNDYPEPLRKALSEQELKSLALNWARLNCKGQMPAEKYFEIIGILSDFTNSIFENTEP